ncbi:LysM peptidoglycan-binding domain-containing protein [Vibrio parahaemolyticus]|uniref:LysM peptidoglycan-binding domain-containing protein n=1 Tax=Vibrio parahaemolyticus TaxID=670 RepID=UPI0032974335
MLYKIKQDDCLSLIAERFNTTPEALAKLNSEQIKHLDLIYEGDTLKIALPKPIVTDGARIDLSTAPTEMNGGNDTCSSKPREWADILYVPSHPKTGKKMWYRVSELARAELLKEKERVSAAIVENDTPKTLQNLTQLGVMSKFSAKLHEQFMTKDEALIYRKLLWVQKVITMGTYGDKSGNDFLLSAAQLVGIDLEVTRWELAEEEKANNRALYYGPFPSLYHAKFDEMSQEAKMYFNASISQQLRTLVLNRLQERIDDMESNAEKTAGQRVAEDGTKFVYSSSLNYFTTQKEQAIDTHLTQYHTAKSALKTEEEIALLSHEQAREYVEGWQASLQSAQQTRLALKEAQFAPSFSTEASHYLQCASALIALNQRGVVVKEQCLRVDELEGLSLESQGPEAFRTLSWRATEGAQAKPLDMTSSDVAEKISAAYERLFGHYDGRRSTFPMASLVNNREHAWSYYPAKALIAVINATITKHKDDFALMLGEKGLTPFDETVQQLLWIKRFALARLTELHHLAQQRAEKGPSGLIPETVLEHSNAMPAVLTLLWDDSAFTPKNVSKSGFINQAGYNDIQIVECSLLSDGEVFYVRGPDWYMPESSEDRLCYKGAFHIEVLSNQTFTAMNTSGQDITHPKSLPDALRDLSNPRVKVNLASLTKASVFWQDSYHVLDESAADSPSSYSVEAGAQLFRLVMKAESELNLPPSPLSAPVKRNFTGNSSVSAQFSAMQGQVAFTYWLPQEGNQHRQKTNLNGVGLHAMALPYQKQGDKTPSPYPLGAFALCAFGSVHGLAGVSCQLGHRIEFGPTNIDEGFGIKGNTIMLIDPNIRDAYALGNNNLISAEQAKLAGEASLEVNVFAGVEAGGHLGGAVYWQPPESPALQTPHKLGSIEGQMSATWGAGVRAIAELKLQGGVLLFIVDAKLAVGPGCAGKVAIELNADATDAFLLHLFTLLKRNDFRRLSLFGEVDENGHNESFELLNDVMTIAMATGLTVASVLLMPHHLWKDYKRGALSREYAPAIARRINQEKDNNVKGVHQWIIKLPPETLCNLLNCLCEEQLFSKEKNHLQAQAIVQIMQWLSAETQDSTFANQRLWKESLIAMGGLPKGTKDAQLEWQTYKEQWFKLANFVRNFDEQYSNKLKDIFDDKSKVLCGNMVLTRSVEQVHLYNSSSPIDVNRYDAYPVSIVSNATEIGAKAIITVEERRKPTQNQTEQIIITWSIDDVF